MSATTRPGGEGRDFVKGYEQLVDPAPAQAAAVDEFPHRDSLLQVDRREVLKVMGVTLALSALAGGCRFQPQQKIVPYVVDPEGYTAGADRTYATAASCGGYAIGLLARSYEGRPVKLEGNPGHPSSLGGIDARTLAEVAVLYDPDRHKNPTSFGDFGTWPEFLREVRAELEGGGAGVAVLTPNVGSPTLAGLLEEFKQRYPGAEWYQYEPVHRDSVREGAMLAFGRDVHTVYDFSAAKVVVGFDADFVSEGPGHAAYCRGLAQGRAVSRERTEMSRLYAFEAAPTLFGAMADHRFRVRPSQALAVAQALATRLGLGGGPAATVAGVDAKVLDAVAADLEANRGASILVAGAYQSPQVHALLHAINAQLGNLGRTVVTTEPVLPRPVSNVADIKALTEAMQAGRVRALLILGGNPVYDAPADVEFGERLKAVKLTAHLSLYKDETSSACKWQLPASHFLEAWGDGRGHDGTAGVVQPLIEPMYDTKSAVELVDALLRRSRPGLECVRSHWQPRLGANPDAAWAEALATGVLPGTAAAPVSPTVVPNLLSGLQAPAATGVEMVVLPDPCVYDGRYSNIGWLQELPKPLTNLTWDNAVHMGPAMAKRLGVGQPQKMVGIVPFYGPSDLVTVTANGQSVTAPVYVHMGMADETVLVHLGYGRTQSGQVGTKKDEKRGGGFDFNPFRTTAATYVVPNVQVAKAPGSYGLANAQFHNLLDVTEVDSDRDIIREVTLAKYIEDPKAFGKPTHGIFAGGHGHEGEGHGAEKGEKGEKEKKKGKGLYAPPAEFYDETKNYQWAMTVDLNLCTGCNACVTACQAENNIPTVGKEQVMRGREMHWIRIDRYYRKKGASFDENDPLITLQPVTCVQCEMAPCEPVCPVAATVHSHEGINQMVYNRCVGTRYCSNNCPYKVRRFNFLHYTDKVEQIPVLKLLQNPDVTVRGRGVMEKCTYCVHRINHSRIEAKRKDREIADGEVVTACQQACPTGAIVFGDMRRPENAVAKSRLTDRNYALLEILNTRPRTTHLGRVTNPNPSLEA